MFVNPPPEEIAKLLRTAHLIAVVGLSRRARAAEPRGRARPAGFRLPRHSRDAGRPGGPGRASPCPRSRSCRRCSAPGERVDIVDVFRRPEHVAGIVDECIRLKLPALWLQEGVIDEVAAARAVQAGIFMVMDRCLYRDRAALR